MDKEPLVTEEPHPGWQRFENEGRPPWFKTPPPRTVIRTRSQLKEYLEREHSHDRKLDIDGSQFSFKRRLGLKRHQLENRSDSSLSDKTLEVRADEVISNTLSFPNISEKERVVKNPAQQLVRNKEVLDHRKLLTNMAKAIDSFRISDSYKTPDNFDQLKERIASGSDINALLVELHNNKSVVEALDMMFSDSCLTEIFILFYFISGKNEW